MMRKHLLLATIALLLLATPIYSYDKCVHDKNAHPAPIIMDPETDNLDAEGRLLAESTTLPKMRIYPYYGAMGSDTKFNSYVQNYLIPPIIDYFQNALTVKYPLGSTFKMSVAGVCGISTPDDLKAGVAGDMYWILADAYDQGNSWLADSWACYLMSGSKRPYISKTTFNRWDFTTTTDVLVHEKNIVCTMHEFIHNLGFSSSLYGVFLDSNGVRRTGHVSSEPYFGYNSTVVNVEPLTSRLRNHFGCSTLKGAYMENTGGSGTVGSHFERRIFANEVMTSGLIYDQVVSEFTLALLEGTGWYTPDYKYAEILPFGQGQGCSFVTGNCNPNQFSEWCIANLRGCNSQGTSGSTCASDWRSDGCRFQHPAYNYNCQNPNGVKYARFPTMEVYGRGSGSKCFEGTLAPTTSKSPTDNSMCLKFQCKANSPRLLGSRTVSRTVNRYISHVNGTKDIISTNNRTTTYSNGTIAITITVNFTQTFPNGTSIGNIDVTYSVFNPNDTPIQTNPTNPTNNTSSTPNPTNNTSSNLTKNDSSSIPNPTNNTSGSGTKNDTATNPDTNNPGTETSDAIDESDDEPEATPTSYKLILELGSTSVTCTEKGPVSVPGFIGTIKCPDPLEYCTTIGAPACPRNCMGRGTCVNGKCQCKTGFSGTDCTLGPKGEFY